MFDHTKPLVTRTGWEARLIGILVRDEFPLVVAVKNPAFGGKEELLAYSLDGETPSRLTEASPCEGFGWDKHPQVGLKNGPMSLLNQD